MNGLINQEPPYPDFVDVTVVGAGPAGCMSSLCLTTYGLSVFHADDRAEPTTAGRADGIQPRTIEILRNIGGAAPHQSAADKASGRAPFHGGGLAKKLINAGVRVYEVAFWDPTETAKLARTSRAPSCPDFIDVVDNYTLLLHQGLIERAFFEETEQSQPNAHPTPYGGVFRNCTFTTLRTLKANEDDRASIYPVEATFHNTATDKTIKVRSKYLLGYDGAWSPVRRCISGDTPGRFDGVIQMEGEATDIVWGQLFMIASMKSSDLQGVIDATVTTNFPDIKYKTLIHSKSAGSIMTIPRESNLVRFYVQLKREHVNGDATDHVDKATATQDVCIQTAKRIFEPYTLDFGHVDWFSVYQIGQRVANKYTLDHRILLGGDATHTHSPKAGQGMNISMADAYNLAWKINLIEKGIGKPDVLLPSYELERREIAQRLIAFDAQYSRLFSGRNPNQAELANNPSSLKSGAVDAQKFIEVFKQNAEFTSGVGAVYTKASALTNFKLAVTNASDIKLKPGGRLTPGKATRVMDANQVRLHQEVRMNGAFRIFVFAGNLDKTKSTLASFGKHLGTSASFLSRYKGLGACSIVDGFWVGSNDDQSQSLQSGEATNPYFTFLTVVATDYYIWEINDIPEPFRNYRTQVYGDNIYDRRVHAAGKDAPLHVKYGIDRSKGCIVVVRPDMYIGHIADLDKYESLDTYFSGFLQSL